MPSNEVISAALAADPVPPERECIKTLSQVLDGAVDFLKIVGVANASQGGEFPTNNNTAQQALTTANAALAAVNALNVPQRRTSSGEVTLPTGNPVSVISLSPPMPSAIYAVYITFIGPDSTDDQMTVHVIDGSATVNSVQLKFSGVPANYSYLWEVVSL